LEGNALREEAAGIDWETPEFTRLNRAVVDAESKVPWWRDDWREKWDRFKYRRIDRLDYDRAHAG
jgi:hypothetical protein